MTSSYGYQRPLSNEEELYLQNQVLRAELQRREDAKQGVREAIGGGLATGLGLGAAAAGAFGLASALSPAQRAKMGRNLSSTVDLSKQRENIKNLSAKGIKDVEDIRQTVADFVRPSQPAPKNYGERVAQSQENARQIETQKGRGPLVVDLEAIQNEPQVIAKAKRDLEKEAVYSAVAAKPESELPRVFKPSGGAEVELITDPNTGEIFRRGKSPESFKETYVKLQGTPGTFAEFSQEATAIAEQATGAQAAAQSDFGPQQYMRQVGYKEAETLVDQQDLGAIGRIDQFANAANPAEDQATGRVKMALQRNEDENLAAIEMAEDALDAQIAKAAQDNPAVASASEVDAAINQVAAQRPDGVPFDQAEGIDLRTGERFAIKQTGTESYPKSTLGATGLVPGQKIAFEQAPESAASSSAARFMEAERNKISQELAEQGIAALPEDIDAELAKRVSGSEAWTYGPKYTQRKQALQLGSTLGGEPLENLRTSSVVIGGETVPVSSLKEPVFMEGTAEKLLERANRKRDWLGSVRLKQQQDQIRLDKVNQQIEELTNYKTEITNFLASGRATSEQARTGKQRLSDLSLDLDRLSGLQSQLSNVAYTSAKGLAGAESYTSSALQEMTVPSKLASGVEEGFVVRPKRTAPDTMSFEAEGGELSNLERGRPANILSSEELEIVPGGLLSGGRAKVVSNIGKDIGFDPATGERVVVPLVDPDTGEDVVQKLAGKRMGETIGVRGRGGSAGLETMSSQGIYGTELSKYGTAAQTQSGAYTEEASQVPSLVTGEPIPRRSGGFFKYPQQREANPEKYIQTPTQQSVESFDVARTLRQLQQSGRPGEAQAFLDKIMKQRGVSDTSGSFSPLR